MTLVLGSGLLALIAVTAVLSQVQDDLDAKKQEALPRLDENAMDPGEVEAQRQIYEEANKQMQVDFEAWLAEFNKSGTDPRALQRRELAISTVEPPRTLDAAVDSSSLVIDGTVENVRFEAGPMTLGRVVASLKVNDIAKGALAPGDTITIWFAGGPHPAEDGKAVMAYFPSAPLLLEGDRAVLLLVQSPSLPGTYEAIIGAGVNQVQNDRMTALDQNLFASEVRGRTIADFIATLRQAAQN